jgi:hypothetical protein
VSELPDSATVYRLTAPVVGGCRSAYPPPPVAPVPRAANPSADGWCVYMYSARPRVISDVESLGENGRARMRSNQYDVPPAETSASKIAAACPARGQRTPAGQGSDSPARSTVGCLD